MNVWNGILKTSTSSWIKNVFQVNHGFLTQKIDICFLVCFDIHLNVISYSKPVWFVKDFKSRINMMLYSKVYDKLPLVCVFIHVNLLRQYPLKLDQNICNISAFYVLLKENEVLTSILRCNIVYRVMMQESN